MCFDACRWICRAEKNRWPVLSLILLFLFIRPNRDSQGYQFHLTNDEFVNIMLIFFIHAFLVSYTLSCPLPNFSFNDDDLSSSEESRSICGLWYFIIFSLSLFSVSTALTWIYFCLSSSRSGIFSLSRVRLMVVAMPCELLRTLCDWFCILSMVLLGFFFFVSFGKIFQLKRRSASFLAFYSLWKRVKILYLIMRYKRSATVI